MDCTSSTLGATELAVATEVAGVLAVSVAVALLMRTVAVVGLWLKWLPEGKDTIDVKDRA
jgi:hypothetical protein